MSSAVTVVEPRPASRLAPVTEAWRHRAMVPFWGRRFVQKLYLRTVLGRVWIVLRPALEVGSRLFVFGGVLSVSTGETPYVLVLLAGSAGWEVFQRSAYWSTRALELNRRFLRRMYAPRLTMLAGALWPAAVYFLIYVAFLLIAAAAYAISGGSSYLSPSTLPAALAGAALAALLALSLGLWLSVWGARARDVRFTLGYVLGFWMFLTPVVYPLSEVPAGLRTWVELNPLTAPVELVKHGLLGLGQPPATSLVSSLVTIAVIGGAGLLYFGRAEAEAVDQL